MTEIKKQSIEEGQKSNIMDKRQKNYCIHKKMFINQAPRFNLTKKLDIMSNETLREKITYVFEAKSACQIKLLQDK